MSLLDPSIEDLPLPIMVDILSRLPVKTIIHSKCVCKKWRNIILDSYFAEIHFSRSPPGLTILHSAKYSSGLSPGILKWVEVNGELDHYHLHHDPVMSLDLNLSPTFQNSQLSPVGSVNGLICLSQFGLESDNTYICNPITREYMILPRKKHYRDDYENIVYCFGVGVGSHTREYKVIRIFRSDIISEAEVYTLGTGEWRSLGRVPYKFDASYVPYLNGNAHWIICDQEYYPQKICVFNFDNETFELFPSPHEAIEESRIHLRRLGVLKGCLCLCDTYESKLIVWVMKEYGIKSSWYKEFVVKYSMSSDLDVLFQEPAYPIELFKDGAVLMTTYEEKLIVYCPRRNRILDTEIFDGFFKGLAYCPSFHRLHNFVNERVCVF